MDSTLKTSTNICTPNRRFLTPNNSPLEKSLSVKKTRRIVRASFLWGSLNFLVFSILLYDLLYSCPFRYGISDYIKYTLLIIVGINCLYYLCKIFILNLNNPQIALTLQQKKLLGIRDDDPNFKVVENLPPVMETPTQSVSNSPNNSAIYPSSSTPMNVTALSWQSLSPNESLNYSLSSSWTYHKVPNDPNISYSPTQLEFKDTSGVEFISNQQDLDQYLKDFEANSSVNNLSAQTQQSSNLLSSFWSHPVTQTAKDMSSFLRRCTYQVSTQSPTNIGSSSPKTKEKLSPTTLEATALAPWLRFNVDMVTLTQWNENLRRWLSQTILERLVREFDKVNESLEKHGLAEIKIGAVGLDRLRKTAQMAHLSSFVPTLAALIPFLEVSPNQEYVVKRIRELAKGGCMSDFRWNGGSSHNGKEWEDSLPTDSVMVMHLLASYLDTQLMPLPSMPDAKPFSGIYYVKAKDKLPPLTPQTTLIQQVSERPPHFRVVVGETIYEMVKGYSNLFHSILFFLYHVNLRERGMLGQVNLGRAGVNMLWIIGE